LETALPVRKIPKNYLGVTGGFSSRKNGRMLGFESLLEKDFFILLEYDDEVLSFEEQPVRIPLGGKAKSYVPDVVVHYRQKSPSKKRKPLLAEVKTVDDLKKTQLSTPLNSRRQSAGHLTKVGCLQHAQIRKFERFD